jgi:hypothetical protein
VFNVAFGIKRAIIGAWLPVSTLPVGHAVPKKFGSISPCYILLHSLCRAHLTVLLTQRPS